MDGKCLKMSGRRAGLHVAVDWNWDGDVGVMDITRATVRSEVPGFAQRAA